jgi:uncharacterized protein (DUF2249 family)
MKTRKQIMKEITDALVDGHPNPEGYIEWCESLTDGEFMSLFADHYPQQQKEENE